MPQHIKVCVLGASSVGKSSMIQMFANRRFDINTKPTIGTDIATKAISVGADGVVTIQLIDTAGQERHRALNQTFFRGSEACIIVFDITNAETFDALEEWVDDFRRHVHIEEGERFPFFVVGNKTDLEEERQVSKGDAARWCAQQGYTYKETSAKLSDGIDALFRESAEAVVHRRKQRQYLDEGSMPSGVQRARLVPIKSSANAQAPQEKKMCGGCGGGE